mmetsp:Transcript_2361/g.5053  ORF Transcript_2361/g.5053 Transcript_2361/m.5053 type:complete len:118 (-) Transcript_2361:53-406(-)
MVSYEHSVAKFAGGDGGIFELKEVCTSWLYALAASLQMLYRSHTALFSKKQFSLRSMAPQHAPNVQSSMHSVIPDKEEMESGEQTSIKFFSGIGGTSETIVSLVGVVKVVVLVLSTV